MIEPDEPRPGAADEDGAPVVGDPAGRARWDRARRELTVSPPPLATILLRARTTRRRAFATVAVVAAVSATIVVVPLVGSLRADDRGPAGPQAPIRTTAVSTSLPSPATVSSVSITPASPTPASAIPVVVSLSLADPQHGFAVSQQCDDPSKGAARCRYGVWRFDATAPRPWTAVISPVPDGSTDNGWSGDLVAFSTDRVVIHSVSGDRQKSAWFSADGGRTWTDSVKRGPLLSIPAGGRPTVGCIALTADLSCERTGILVDLPDGSWAMLAMPTGVTPSTVMSGPDGRWWLVGTRGGAIVAGPTPDSGRSWSLSTVAAKPSRSVFWYQLVFAGPSVVWLEVIGQHPDDDVKNGLLAIHRSADGGRVWSPVWTAAAGTEPRTQIGAAIGGSGSLQLCTELGEPYRIDATGRATELSTGCSSDAWRERTAWGYLERTPGSASPGRTSTDGVRWAAIPLLPSS